MASNNTVIRWIRAVFDRDSAKQMEQAFEASLRAAGQKSGDAFLTEVRAAFDAKMSALRVLLAKGLIDPAQFKTQASLAAQEFNSSVIAGMEKARAAGTLTNAEYLKLSRTLKTVGDDGESFGTKLSRTLLRLGSAFAAFFAFRSEEH